MMGTTPGSLIRGRKRGVAVPNGTMNSPTWCRKWGYPLLGLASAASCIISVGAIAFWVGSYSLETMMIWRRPEGDSWIAGACRGQILLGRSRYPGIDSRRRGEATGLFWHSGPPRPSYPAHSSLDPCRTRVINEGSPDPPHPFDFGTYYDHSIVSTHFDHAGFAYQEGLRRSMDGRGRTLSTIVTSNFLLVPCWAVALASAAGPIMLIWRAVARRRKSLAASAFDVLPGGR